MIWPFVNIIKIKLSVQISSHKWEWLSGICHLVAVIYTGSFTMILDLNMPKKLHIHGSTSCLPVLLPVLKPTGENGIAKPPFLKQTTPSTSLKNKHMLISELQVLLKCQHVKLLKSPSFSLTYMSMSLHIKMCVTVCLGFLTRVYAKRMQTWTHQLFTMSFHLHQLWKKSFLSGNLCTETQLKAFMLQSQFTVKWLGGGKSLNQN